MLIRVGRLLKSHGVRGQAKCSYTTDEPQNIPNRSSYLLFDPLTKEVFPIKLLSAALKDNYFLARFESFESPEQLRPYLGWDIMYVRCADQPREPGEIYYFELEGLEVRTQSGVVLGTVERVLDSGAHVLLEVSGLKGRLLPFTEMYVPEVNLEQGYLVTTYPVDSPGDNG